MDSWAMVEATRTPTRLQPRRSTSARAELLLRCLLAISTCAILDNGDLKCWGSNSQGQLGDGSNTNATHPPAIDLGTGRTAVAIDLGTFHTCAILDNSDLSVGDLTLKDEPVTVEGTATKSHGFGFGSNTWSNSTTSNTGSGTSCSISPALPTGLSIDSSTCTIGTPSVATSNTTTLLQVTSAEQPTKEQFG